MRLSHHKFSLLILFSCGWLWVSSTGCHFRNQVKFDNSGVDCTNHFTQIEYADVCDTCVDDPIVDAGEPVTAENFDEQEPWPLTLEESIHMALANSKILSRLGGRVLSAPGGAVTAFDPAIIETNPFNSAEAALSDFDAQAAASATYNHNERIFNNIFFGGGAVGLTSNTHNYRASVTKTTASGATFSLRSITDFNQSDNPTVRFESFWDTVWQAEWRQPLAQGFGTAVNRIAGPNGRPGNYNLSLIHI